MAVLSPIGAVAVAITTGCYAPELRDCAVSCETSAECAPEQVCGSDRMCASPALAGRCARALDANDAAVDAPIDAGADAPIDAPPPRWIRIEINGHGTVGFAGVGTCHTSAPMHICMFVVPAGVVAQLDAVPDPEYRFDKWEAGPCIGQGAACAFLPAMVQTEIKAKFKDD
jgi:hypothetical protein